MSDAHMRWKQKAWLRPIIRQKGLSLVELLVALALSAGLILGVLTVYTNSNQTSRLSESLARIQESGRIATEIMARDLRMVGYQGCADPMSIQLNIIAQNPPTSNFANSALRGWEVTSDTWANGTEFDGTLIETNASENSDVIAIQRGQQVPITVSGNMTSTNANVQVTGQLGLFKQDDIVMISNCEAADLFRITSNSDGTWAHANGSNDDNRLSQAYTQTASIMRFSSTTYFVADTGRDDGYGEPIYALYRQTNDLINNATATFTVEEIVEGVESMQILYGQRTAGNGMRYVPADDAGLDMTEVVAVRIGLLMSNAEAVLDGVDQLTYDLPGQSIQPEGTSGAVAVHPKDRRIRRTFTTTISLRNRRF